MVNQSKKQESKGVKRLKADLHEAPGFDGSISTHNGVVNLLHTALPIQCLNARFTNCLASLQQMKGFCKQPCPGLLTWRGKRGAAFAAFLGVWAGDVGACMYHAPCLGLPASSINCLQSLMCKSALASSLRVRLALLLQ